MKNVTLLFASLLFFAFTGTTQQSTLIPFGDSWKYLDNGTNPGTNWTATSFDDALWSTGNGKFGHGLSDATTIISYGPNPSQKYITTYFRKKITIANPALYTAPYTVNFKRDDGVVVYLNGVEYYRSKMASGTPTYTTLATGVGDKGAAPVTFTIKPTKFVAGVNVIAVEIHLQSPSSPEMAFDLELKGSGPGLPTGDQTPPTVQSINRQLPTTSTTNATSVVWRVTFSEAVNNVDVADFALTTTSGNAAGTISSIAPSGSGGNIYDVTINNITGTGVLRLDLKNSGTGIADPAGNAIGGGYTNGQTYTIESSGGDVTPPLVSGINRQSPGSSPTTATTVIWRVAFNEAVNGVDVSDFTLTTSSGNADGDISSIAPSGSTTYDISVNNITGTGVLRLDLKSSGTGIADVAGNPINGGYTNGQTYTIETEEDVPPVVSGINRQSPTGAITSATTVTWRVIFSESVDGVGSSDFTLVRVSGSVNGTVSGVSEVGSTGTTYDVTVNSITGNGVLRLDLKNSGTGITDEDDNDITSGFNSGETYTIQQTTTPSGFVSVTPLKPVNINAQTKDKPQAKAWTYAGKWWCVLGVSGGSKLYRLDGTTWVETLTLSSSSSARADCWVTGNLVHILLYAGASSSSAIASVEYDPATGNYKRWSQRTSNSSVSLPSGSESATIVVDGSGRAWIATDASSDIRVWSSASPYTSWGSPITIATGLTSDDISALTVMPGKIGILWSNQNTKLFGFKTHEDGQAPGTWSSDERPASQSALNEGRGLADDHMNIVTTSDGTVYCAVKTSYDDGDFPQVALLVRRPNGTWDNLYAVTEGEGTQPIAVVNEAQGKVKVVYTTETNGGDIVYRESSLSNISFGPERNLITGGGSNYNFATSTHQPYTTDVVILATNQQTNPDQAAGVLASDVAGSPVVLESSVEPLTEETPEPVTNSIVSIRQGLFAYPNPVTSHTTLNFTASSSGKYILTLYDSKGMKVSELKQGWADGGVPQNIRVDAASWKKGLYFISVKTNTGIKVVKVVVK